MLEHGSEDVKDVQKIVEFSRQFKSLLPPPASKIPTIVSSPSSMSDEKAGFGFDLALQHLRGGFRMARHGWNGKGMFVELQVPDEHSKMMSPYLFLTRTAQTCAPDDANQTPPVISDRIPWLASQADLLADDWYTSEFQNVDLKVQR